MNATGTLQSYDNFSSVSGTFPVEDFIGNNTQPPPEQSVGSFELHIVISLTIFYAFVFILGLTGNGLVIYSIKCCRKLHNVTCVLLANLAAADLILIVCVLPFKLATSFISYWVFGAAVCRLLPYLQVLSPACSIFTMAAISVERYYAVIYPLRAKSVLTLGRAKRVVIVLWFVSIVYSIPAFYSKNFTKQRFDGYDETIPNCNDGWPGASIEQAYALYLFIFIFAVPLMIVTYCYVKVILALNRSHPPESMTSSTDKLPEKIGNPSIASVSDRNLSRLLAARLQQEYNMSVRQSDENLSKVCEVKESASCRIVYETDRRRLARRDEKRKVVLMLVVVVLLFVFLWGPVLSYNVLLRFGLGTPNDWTTWRISVAFHLMAYFNSCTNPVVYFFVSKHFRESFLTVMLCRKEGPEQNDFQMGSVIGRSKCNSKVMMSTSSPRITQTTCSHV